MPSRLDTQLRLISRAGSDNLSFNYGLTRSALVLTRCRTRANDFLPHSLTFPLSFLC